ncbi:hypothetical protein [Streptomyces sp. ISID311]|nr:hypothetical protein [Streptomyces sp. ISID311]
MPATFLPPTFWSRTTLGCAYARRFPQLFPACITASAPSYAS